MKTTKKIIQPIKYVINLELTEQEAEFIQDLSGWSVTVARVVYNDKGRQYEMQKFLRNLYFSLSAAINNKES